MTMHSNSLLKKSSMLTYVLTCTLYSFIYDNVVGLFLSLAESFKVFLCRLTAEVDNCGELQFI